MRERTSIGFILAAMAGLAGCLDTQSTSSSAAASSPLTAAAASSTAPGASSSAPPWTLLASVTTHTGSTFEFYGDEIGGIYYSEFGGKDAKPSGVATKGLSPAQVWAKVAPNRPAPQALADAEALWTPAPANSAAQQTSSAAASGSATSGVASLVAGLPVVASDASPPPGDPNDFCSGAWAYNNLANFKADCNGGGNYSWCLYDIAPGAGYYGNNITDDEAEICNKNSSSDVLLSVNRDNSQGGSSWSVPSGSWRWFVHGGGTCCWGLCLCSYNIHIDLHGSWGDVQFAGDFLW